MPEKRGVRRRPRTDRPDFFEIKIKGKRYWLGANLGEAYEKAAKLLKAADEPLGHVQVVSELTLAWHAAHPDWRYQEYATPWKNFAGDIYVVDLPIDHLRKYADHLIATTYQINGVKDARPRKYAPETIRKYVRYAHVCLTWAAEQGMIEDVPLYPKKLPKPIRHPRDIEDHDLLRAAFDSMHPQARRVMGFILTTGCRPGEARTLRWSDVDEKRGLCTVANKTAHSTGAMRTIYLTPEARAILRDTPRESAYVFLSQRGTPYAANSLRTIMRRSGIQGGVYPLRHTYAQRTLEADVPIQTVAGLLGHAGLRTVQVYCRVRDPEKMRVAATLTSPLQDVPARDSDAARPDDA